MESNFPRIVAVLSVSRAPLKKVICMLLFVGCFFFNNVCQFGLISRV
jgi:hypothetical protein